MIDIFTIRGILETNISFEHIKRIFELFIYFVMQLRKWWRWKDYPISEKWFFNKTGIYHLRLRIKLRGSDRTFVLLCFILFSFLKRSKVTMLLYMLLRLILSPFGNDAIKYAFETHFITFSSGLINYEDKS